jgi:hypothetical protein
LQQPATRTFEHLSKQTSGDAGFGIGSALPLQSLPQLKSSQLPSALQFAAAAFFEILLAPLTWDAYDQLHVALSSYLQQPAAFSAAQPFLQTSGDTTSPVVVVVTVEVLTVIVVVVVVLDTQESCSPIRAHGAPAHPTGPSCWHLSAVHVLLHRFQHSSVDVPGMQGNVVVVVVVSLFGSQPCMVSDIMPKAATMKPDMATVHSDGQLHMLGQSPA